MYYFYYNARYRESINMVNRKASLHIFNQQDHLYLLIVFIYNHKEWGIPSWNMYFFSRVTIFTPSFLKAFMWPSMTFKVKLDIMGNLRLIMLTFIQTHTILGMKQKRLFYIKRWPYVTFNDLSGHTLFNANWHLHNVSIHINFYQNWFIIPEVQTDGREM